MAEPFAGVAEYLTSLDLLQAGKSRELVIILHGWTSSPDVMKDIKAAVSGRAETGETPALPDADVIVPRYKANALSNVSLYGLAWDLVMLIGAALKERRSRGSDYERIILIGHSIGALVVRKAVVFANGETQDAPIARRPGPQPWACKIERIILFAAMNRGWKADRRPSYARLLPWYSLKLLDLITRRLPFAHLIRGSKRGAPFLADLRVQWLRLLAHDPAGLPATIQMLGTKDDIVAEEDSADLEPASNFTYRVLNGAGHLNAIQLSPIKHPEHKAWRDAFVEVLTAPVDNIPGDPISQPLRRQTDVKNVVFVMHGIRDYGGWTAEVRLRIEAAGAVGITSSYGYFPMGKFLLLAERRRNVRWFMDQYTEALIHYPNASVSFIGHSNGTYLLASALKQYKTPVFDRVVFAGSVVPRRFIWDQLVGTGRVKAVQNYVATRDLVVAWFPSFFEWLADVLHTEADIGGAGHNGFVDDTGRRYAIEFVRGGHAAALHRNNMLNLVAFALGKEVTAEMIPNRAGENERSTVVSLGHKFCPLIWLVLIVVIISLVALPYLIPGLLGSGWAKWWVVGTIAMLWLTLTRI